MKQLEESSDVKENDSKSSGANWNSLPHEMILYIFSFLRMRDLATLCLVCKKFDLFNDDIKLWGAYIKNEFKLNESESKKIGLITENKVSKEDLARHLSKYDLSNRTHTTIFTDVDLGQLSRQKKFKLEETEPPQNTKNKSTRNDIITSCLKKYRFPIKKDDRGYFSLQYLFVGDEAEFRKIIESQYVIDYFKNFRDRNLLVEMSNEKLYYKKNENDEEIEEIVAKNQFLMPIVGGDITNYVYRDEKVKLYINWIIASDINNLVNMIGRREAPHSVIVIIDRNKQSPEEIKKYLHNFSKNIDRKGILIIFSVEDMQDPNLVKELFKIANNKKIELKYFSVDKPETAGKFLDQVNELVLEYFLFKSKPVDTEQMEEAEVARLVV